MKIVTWNVNSLRARAELVTLFLDEEAPDVLCLQELKMETDTVPVEIFAERGYAVEAHGQKSWNGVLVAAREEISGVKRGLPDADEGEARLIAVEIGGLALVNLYCPQGQSVDSPKFPYKLGFFDGLIDWLGTRVAGSSPLVVLGDFNIAPNPEDVWSVEAMDGIPTYHPEEHRRWARLLDLGLIDVVESRVEAGTFSFWDYRGGAFRFNRGMRIDHILATEPVLPRVQDAWVARDWRKKRQGLTPSDHAPVVLELD
jgi:exodeoxyribonuclease-3